MKKYKCHDCEGEFQAETREEMLDVLYKHYMEKHADTITKATGEEKKTWMEQFEKNWVIAEEV